MFRRSSVLNGLRSRSSQSDLMTYIVSRCNLEKTSLAKEINSTGRGRTEIRDVQKI